jgi:Ion channel
VEAPGEETEAGRTSRRELLRLVARAPDSYGLLLVLLIVDYTAATVTWTGSVALVVRSVLLALTVLLAFHASRAPRRVQLTAQALVAAAVLAAIVAAVQGGTAVTGSVVLFMSILVLACPIVVGWRILHHAEVTPETILGGICIYVLIGMVFTNADYGLQLASGRDFFAQPGHHGLPDFAYFSYITMATVGYGDLSPAPGLPRTSSVLEALLGQVFLVVLLARLVSLYRGPAGWRRDFEERVRGGRETGATEGSGASDPIPGAG